MKVSVCIPSYNLEDKIEKCLTSIIEQTMDSNDYEIIVVDDCSKDETVKVVKGTFDKYNFTNGVVKTLPENSGHASKPRNRTMELAKGEYIYFVDGDDFLYPEALERMYNLGHKNNSDMVVGKYKGINREVPQDMFRHKKDIVDGQIVEHRFMWTLSVLKMFKRSELERNNIKFDLEEAVGEDMLFTTDFLANTKRHSILGTYDCYACVGHESDHLSKRPRTTENYLGMQKKIVKVIKEGTCFTDREKEEAIAKLYTRTLVIGKNNTLYNLDNYTSLEVRNKWLKDLKSYTEEYVDINVIKYLTLRERQMYYAIMNEDIALVISIVAQEKQRVAMKKEIDTLKKQVASLSDSQAEINKIIEEIKSEKSGVFSKLKRK